MAKEKESLATANALVNVDSDPSRYSSGDESTTLPPIPELTPEQERRLWRKMDMRLLPILALMYLMAFLDRGIVMARSV
ncbi:hypothetical protein APHAL10511_002996 [Amanita phalloides]|nr:hypothetical protein APHAL10511_002996 [Amanita phalloides]